jgi:hypothetical protein
MSDALKRSVQSALMRVLQPLVRWVLDAGIGVGEFVNLVKVAYVRAAVEQGRSVTGSARPNISRISVVTGLTRVEVASLLEQSEGETPSSDRGRQRAERVLSAWWTDPEFLTAKGEPEVLRLKGPRRSFAALCERYSGEKRSAPVLQELLRVGAVRALSEGRLQALSRSCTRVRWDPAGVEAVGEQLRDHCLTLLENLHHPTRARFARQVVNTQLDPRHAPMLIREIENALAVRTDALHEALNDPGHTAPAGTSGMRLGVGVYVFEEASSGEGESRNNESTARSQKRRPARKRRRE